MKNKEIHYPYYCKKCTRTVYYTENDVKNDICKICGSKMEEETPIISHPKDNLKNIRKKQQQNKELATIWGLVAICILAIFLMIQCFSCVNGDDNDDNYVCSSCHKTFTNRADTKSIAYTSMCEPCYENYKFKQELQEEIKKYQERN